MTRKPYKKLFEEATTELAEIRGIYRAIEVELSVAEKEITYLKEELRKSITERNEATERAEQAESKIPSGDIYVAYRNVLNINTSLRRVISGETASFWDKVRFLVHSKTSRG